MAGSKDGSSGPRHRPIPTPSGQFTKAVDQANLPHIHVIQAHGRLWVLHQGEASSAGGAPITVNGRLLRPGDSLPIREGEIIQQGDLTYQFQREFFPERPAYRMRRARLLDGKGGTT